MDKAQQFKLLSLADSQSLQRVVGIKFKAETAGQIMQCRSHGLLVKTGGTGHEVIKYRELEKVQWFLVQHTDTQGLSIFGCAQTHFLPVKKDAA